LHGDCFAKLRHAESFRKSWRQLSSAVVGPGNTSNTERRSTRKAFGVLLVMAALENSREKLGMGPCQPNHEFRSELQLILLRISFGFLQQKFWSLEATSRQNSRLCQQK
jgi:hypothetical protein